MQVRPALASHLHGSGDIAVRQSVVSRACRDNASQERGELDCPQRERLCQVPLLLENTLAARRRLPGRQPHTLPAEHEAQRSTREGQAHVQLPLRQHHQAAQHQQGREHRLSQRLLQRDTSSHRAGKDQGD